MAETQLTDDQVAAIQATQTAGQDAAGAGDGAYQISLPNEAYGTKMTRQEHKLLLQTAVANAGRVFKDGTITFGVEAIMWYNGDALVNKAAVGTQSLTNNQTNYIYYTASGTLTVNITGFPVPSVTSHLPLATIATGSASGAGTSGTYAYSDITDKRQLTAIEPSNTGAGLLNDLSWQDIVLDELNFTAAEPAAPTVGQRYLNTGSGASSVTAQVVAANDIEIWNGTDWSEITPSDGYCAYVDDRNELIGFETSWLDLGSFTNLRDLTDGGNADALHIHSLITTADESADTTCFVAYFTAASGSLQPKTGTNLTFNSSAGTLTATNVTATSTVTGEQVTSTDDISVAGIYNMVATTASFAEGAIYQDSARFLHSLEPLQQAASYRNVFLGKDAGSSSLDNTTGSHLGSGNVGIGQSALDALTTGYYDFACGALAGTDITTGHSNSLLGAFAGNNVLNGSYNVAIGRGSTFDLTSGNDNSAVGAHSMDNSNGTGNTAMGRSTLAGSNGNSGDYSSALGHRAGGNAYSDHSVYIGAYAGYNHTTQNDVLLINASGDLGSAAAEVTGSLIYGYFSAHATGPLLQINGGLASPPDEITATSGGVAASLTTTNTEVTTNGDSDLDNVTLANGLSGQVKRIYCVAEGNAADTWKITPATMCGGTQITFAGVGEGCTLVYADNEGWVVTGNNGGTIT